MSNSLPSKLVPRGARSAAMDAMPMWSPGGKAKSRANVAQASQPLTALGNVSYICNK